MRRFRMFSSGGYASLDFTKNYGLMVSKGPQWDARREEVGTLNMADPAERDALIRDGVLEIEVFLPEGMLGALSVDDTVLLSSTLNPGLSAESLVVRIAPDIRALPARLWLDPRVPQFGRVALVRGAPALGLSPGQRVLVRQPGEVKQGS